MTSHTLSAFRSPTLEQSRAQQSECTFCQIASGSIPAHLVYEDAQTLAFLDILPIRKGHTLVVPKRHIGTLGELDDDAAGSVAKTLVKVTRGVGRALGDDRLQAITNQGYAQIVPHVHFHIVPAPPIPGSASSSSSSSTSKTTSSSKSQNRPNSNPLSLFGHGREELDDDEAVALAEKIREGIRQTEEERWSSGKAKL